MSFTDLLTIAMPVYERKDFFIEALESALNQTVKCKVLVVDNHSSHDFFEKACKERGVDYYRNEKNIGLFPNFNRCFELSNTKYVMTLQDDDIISPDYVESFLNAVNKHPGIDIYFVNFVRNNYKSQEKYAHSHTLPFGYMKDGKKIIEFGVKFKLGFPLISSCIRKSKFTGFYTNFHSCNDWLWIYTNADNLVFFGNPKVLYEFRDHELQDTKKNAPNLQLSLPYIYEEVLLKKMTNAKLKKKASKNAFWALISFKSGAEKVVINELKTGNSIYNNYLRTKIDKNILLKLVFSMPNGIVDILYRSLRKIGISS